MPRDTSPASMLAEQLRESAQAEGGPSGIDKQAVDIAAIAKKSREEVSDLTDAMNDYLAAVKSQMSANFELSKSESASAEERKKAADNLTNLNNQYKEAIKVSKSLGVSIKDNRNGVVDFGKSLSALSKNFQTATKAISPAVWERLTKAHKQNSDVIKQMRKDYEDAKGEYTENAKRLQGLQVEITGLLVEMNRLQKAQENSNNMSTQERKEIDSKIESVGKNIEVLSKEEKIYRGRQEAIGENIDVIKEFVSSQNDAIESEEELAAKSTLLGKIQSDVRKEVEGLSGGLGEQAVGATAAAVAFVYLGEKIQEYGDKILEIQKAWSDYTVQAQIAARTTPDFSGGINAVNDLRQELSLTREESVSFQKALQKGALAGVSSTTELVEAAKQLTATFGDDPTERLQNYVELLQTIPTLETDLAITASLDDQAAAWFALAEQGKVSQAIELQMAGLLGGEMEMPADQMEAAVESLKTQREMATTMESIEQTIAQYIPEQTALLTKTVGAIAQGVGTIVGIYTGIGVLGTLTSRIANSGPKGTNDAVEDVERAVRSQASKGGGKQAPTVRGVVDRARSAASKGFSRSRAASGGIFKSGQRAIGGAGKQLISGGKAMGGVKGLGLKALGGVAKTLTSNLGSLGSTLGGLGSTAATVAGALAGVAGVIGAALGPFVLIGKYGEEVGDALQDFGSRVRDDGGKAASRFEKGLYTLINGPFNALEDALGIDVLPNVEDFGEMLSTAGKFWSDFASDAYEYLFVSEAEREAKQKAINEYKEEKDLRDEVAAALKRTQQSALAMEEALNLIKSASESPITALSKLGQEVAQMEMEEFTIAGGTVGDFNRALSDGVSATSRELEQMDKAFAKARKKIIEDSDMTAEHRRAALLKLHKAEMEATKVFIDGMMNLIGRFESIPEVAAEELRIGMRNVAKELTMDVGIGIFGDASDAFVENIRSSMNALSGATEQLAADFDNQRKASEMVASRLELDTATVGKELETYRKDVLNAASNMTQAEREKDVKLIDALQDAVSTGDATKAEKVMVGLTDSISRIQAEMGKLAETDLSTSANKATLEYNSAQKEMMASYDTLQEMVKQGAKTLDEMKALDDQREKVAQLGEKVAQAGDKLIENEKALKAIAAERLGIDEASVTKKQLEEVKKEVKSEMDKKNELGRQMIALEQSRVIAEKLVMGASQGTFSLQASKKALDSMNERMQGFLQSINSLAERIENDPFVQSTQRAIDALERQTDLELRLGNSATAVTDLVEKRQEKIERQLQVAKENEQILKALTQGGSAASRQLEAVGSVLSELNKSLQKELDFSELSQEAQKKLQESLGMGTQEIEQALDKQAQDVLSAYNALSEAAKSGAGPEDLKRLGARYMEAQKSFSGTLSEARTAIEAGGGDAGNLESYDEQMKQSTLIAQTYIEGGAKVLEINKAQQANLRAQWFETFDELDRNIDSLKDSIVQKTAAAALEAANANAELAKTHLDVVGATGAYNKGLQATERTYNDLMTKIAERQAETMAKLNKDIAKAEASGNPAAIAAARLKKEEMMAKFANERAKAEQQMLSTSEQIRNNLQEAAMATIDFRKQEVDVQLDLAQSMGSSMGHIFDLQMEQLSLARQERDVKKELLDKAIEQNKKIGGNEEEVAKRRLEYAKSAAEVQKKALGAQRDAFDKILEKSFGAIRSSRGARRQVMTTAQQFGRGYVQNQSTGLVGKGKAQSLVGRQGAAAGIADAWNKGAAPSKSEERTDDALAAANKQQTAAEINRDAANIIHEAAGGIESAAQKYGDAAGMKGTPEASRHPIEANLETKNLEEEIKNGNKASEQGASATQALADAGTTQGSLFTHDIVTENLLKTIAGTLGGDLAGKAVVEGGKKLIGAAKTLTGLTSSEEIIALIKNLYGTLTASETYINSLMTDFKSYLKIFQNQDGKLIDGFAKAMQENKDSSGDLAAEAVEQSTKQTIENAEQKSEKNKKAQADAAKTVSDAVENSEGDSEQNPSVGTQATGEVQVGKMQVETDQVPKEEPGKKTTETTKVEIPELSSGESSVAVVSAIEESQSDIKALRDELSKIENVEDVSDKQLAKSQEQVVALDNLISAMEEVKASNGENLDSLNRLADAQEKASQSLAGGKAKPVSKEQEAAEQEAIKLQKEINTTYAEYQGVRNNLIDATSEQAVLAAQLKEAEQKNLSSYESLKAKHGAKQQEINKLTEEMNSVYGSMVGKISERNDIIEQTNASAQGMLYAQIAAEEKGWGVAEAAKKADLEEKLEAVKKALSEQEEAYKQASDANNIDAMLAAEEKFNELKEEQISISQHITDAERNIAESEKSHAKYIEKAQNSKEKAQEESTGIVYDIAQSEKQHQATLTAIQSQEEAAAKRNSLIRSGEIAGSLEDAAARTAAQAELQKKVDDSLEREQKAQEEVANKKQKLAKEKGDVDVAEKQVQAAQEALKAQKEAKAEEIQASKDIVSKLKDEKAIKQEKAKEAENELKKYTEASKKTIKALAKQEKFKNNPKLLLQQQKAFEEKIGWLKKEAMLAKKEVSNVETQIQTEEEKMASYTAEQEKQVKAASERVGLEKEQVKQAETVYEESLAKEREASKNVVAGKQAMGAFLEASGKKEQQEREAAAALIRKSYTGEIAAIEKRIKQAEAIGDEEAVKQGEADLSRAESAMEAGLDVNDYKAETADLEKPSARTRLEKEYEGKDKDEDYYKQDNEIKKAKRKHSDKTLSQLKKAAQQEAKYAQRAQELREKGDKKGADVYEKMSASAGKRKENLIVDFAEGGKTLGADKVDLVREIQKAHREGVGDTGLGGDSLALIEKSFTGALKAAGLDVTTEGLKQMAMLEKAAQQEAKHTQRRQALSEREKADKGKTKPPMEEIAEAPPKRPEVSERPEPPRTPDERPAPRQPSADLASKPAGTEPPKGEARTTAEQQAKETNNAVPPPSTQTAATEGQADEGTQTSTAMAAKDMNVNVELSFTVDKNGNIVPVVKNIIQSELPGALKKPESQAALEQSGVVYS